MTGRLADRVVHSEPAPWSTASTSLTARPRASGCAAANQTQTSVLAVVDGAWRTLIDRACYVASQLGGVTEGERASGSGGSG